TDLLVAVAPSSKRALQPTLIPEEVEMQGMQCAVADSVARGVSRARRRGRVLVTGSHYVVGEALEYLKKARQQKS
ncbi:MAG: hypothetical protein WBH55_05330, partial [Bacteroidota bacterium]